MTDTATQQGMNPALKIILIVVAILLGLLCAGGLVAAWLVSAGVRTARDSMNEDATTELLESMSANLQALYDRDRELVESLADLGWEGDTAFRDAWGNEVVYTRGPDGLSYTLVSLGADGAPGGEGSAADIVYHRVVKDALAGDDER